MHRIGLDVPWQLRYQYHINSIHLRAYQWRPTIHKNQPTIYSIYIYIIHILDIEKLFTQTRILRWSYCTRSRISCQCSPLECICAIYLSICVCNNLHCVCMIYSEISLLTYHYDSDYCYLIWPNEQENTLHLFQWVWINKQIAIWCPIFYKQIENLTSRRAKEIAEERKKIVCCWHECMICIYVKCMTSCNQCAICFG